MSSDHDTSPSWDQSKRSGEPSPAYACGLVSGSESSPSKCAPEAKFANEDHDEPRHDHYIFIKLPRAGHQRGSIATHTTHAKSRTLLTPARTKDQ
ncbi:hypothetical protein N9L68_02125 [bacterium]|nr:hypothetical protein [bacterium]